MVSAFGADGLRQRYTVATGGGSETQFFYDPQGTLVNRVVSSDTAVKNDGQPFTDVSVWDGYGQRRTDQWTLQNGDVQYAPNDPAGFEGQAGYYADWELSQKQTLGSNQTNWVYLTTAPSLLTRRYYDASTGRFVSRDPIGYQGGQNLYGYCGGNPVNRQDPSGEASDKVALGPGQYYVELDSFIPDKKLTLGSPTGKLFQTFSGDNRVNSPTNNSSRTWEGFVIDTKAGTVTQSTQATGDTHLIAGFLSPWTGNSASLGRTDWESTSSKDASGNFTINFLAVSANPGEPIGEPVITYNITLTFDKSGKLTSSDGIHSAFPAFEIYQYGGGSQHLIYTWDPHNSFDRIYRSHRNWDPATGLSSLVHLDGSFFGPNLAAE